MSAVCPKNRCNAFVISIIMGSPAHRSMDNDDTLVEGLFRYGTARIGVNCGVDGDPASGPHGRYQIDTDLQHVIVVHYAQADVVAGYTQLRDGGREGRPNPFVRRKAASIIRRAIGAPWLPRPIKPQRVARSAVIASLDVAVTSVVMPISPYGHHRQSEYPQCENAMPLMPDRRPVLRYHRGSQAVQAV